MNSGFGMFPQNNGFGRYPPNNSGFGRYPPNNAGFGMYPPNDPGFGMYSSHSARPGMFPPNNAGAPNSKKGKKNKKKNKQGKVAKEAQKKLKKIASAIMNGQTPSGSNFLQEVANLQAQSGLKGSKKGKKKKGKITDSLPQVNWAQVQLEPFEKDFFLPTDVYKNRSPEEVEAFRKTNEITVSHPTAPFPILSFIEGNYPGPVLDRLQANGIVTPTPIQAQALPIATKGMNMVGIAQTGSGKTLAYLLPGAVHVAHQKPLSPGEGPVALVMAPTRELAIQIEQVLKDYFTDLRSVCVYGGADKKPQAAKLRSGVEVIVATPGRLLDHLRDGTTNFKRATYIVLDEADRMLDLGFEPQIRAVLNLVRPDKQILMWSATWPKEIQKLATDYLGDYVQVNIGSQDLSANHNITQHVDVVLENKKMSKLMDLLSRIQKEPENKTIVFVASQKKVDRIVRDIKRQGFTTLGIHGRKTQPDREKILGAFKNGSIRILVATDVAGRGLDIDDISYVINFDFPTHSMEDYVHRIGRTGRCGRSGTAHTFFSEKNRKYARYLIQILEEANQQVHPQLRAMA